MPHPGDDRVRRLTPGVKAVYALGDHTANVALSAVTLLYLRFLTDVAHFSGTVAGTILLTARVLDAFADPLMGRISDLTRWRAGRRRPWFLIGCVPFGIAFAAMWIPPPSPSQLASLLYYTGAFVAMSLAMTMVSVPYLALIPEMSRGYDERTSLNTWRAVGAIAGTFVTIGMSALARRWGDDAEAWARAAAVTAVWLTLPWLAVYRVTWERPVASAAPPESLRDALRVVRRHGSYQRLLSIYITGRIVLDVVSAVFFYYVAWVVGRRDDFELIMLTFLVTVIAALPVWLRLSRRFDKHSVLVVGMVWWALAQLVLAFGGADFSRFTVFLMAAIAGAGYAAVDLMPWAMLPDAIDEDELASGERREGLYTGMFTFLRKIGGAAAVLVVGAVLDLARYDGQAASQPPAAVAAIRFLIAGVPVAVLAISIWLTRGYPLGRERHREILAALESRRAPGQARTG
jgi:GPH family glycoside/pentoside/hexuronide:cation symporter